MSIEELLERIAELLSAHGYADWGGAFQRFLLEYKTEPDTAWVKSKIRSVYGGAGSFNDIVLQGDDGKPLREENEELDRLRHELYTRCQAISHS